MVVVGKKIHGKLCLAEKPRGKERAYKKEKACNGIWELQRVSDDGETRKAEP